MMRFIRLRLRYDWKIFGNLDIIIKNSKEDETREF